MHQNCVCSSSTQHLHRHGHGRILKSAGIRLCTDTASPVGKAFGHGWTFEFAPLHPVKSLLFLVLLHSFTVYYCVAKKDMSNVLFVDS